MKVYLPVYDSGDFGDDHYYEIEEKCYSNLDSAIKEIEDNDFKLTNRDIPEVDSIRRWKHEEIIPMTFNSMSSINGYGIESVAYIKVLNLVQEEE